MEIRDAIKGRRSIRRFTDKRVSMEDITDIISLASYAPSWKNSQTSRYIVITDDSVRIRLANECMMNFEYNKNTLTGAPAVIVQATVNSRSGYERDGSFTTSKGTHWQSFDAGIAAQTLCLAAHEKGIGTVIMGIFDEDKIKELLSISDDISVSSVIAIGYPNESPAAPPRKSAEVLLTVIE